MNLVAIFVVSVAALASSTPVPSNLPDISTICPDIFSYESKDKTDQWSGKLVVETEDHLSGVWIRLVFDKPVISVKVEGDVQTKLDEQTRSEVLIHNRHLILDAHHPITLKVNVKYEDGEAPNVIAYRLNARTICPEREPVSKDFYQGDAENRNFLDTLEKLPEGTGKPNFKCGDKTSSSGQLYPWQASLLLNNRFACEAILIDPSHVLTSAHCVTYKNREYSVPSKYISVQFGKSALKANVSEIFVHPGYEINTVHDDLALIKLSTDVTGSGVATPVCLEFNGSEEGSLLLGYDNKDNDGKGEIVEVKAQRVDNEKCSKELQDVLADGTFCLSYSSDNENCAGNSGSSFILFNDNKATLRGIVSLGLKLQNKNDCNENTAAIVTDTTRYLKWLQRYLKL